MNKLLKENSAEFSQSFIHGALTALSCLDGKLEIMSGIVTDISLLEEYKEQIVSELSSSGLDFHLAIEPSDVKKETQSTRDWASGFLFVISKDSSKILDESSVEFLKDVKQIVSMPFAEDDNQETKSDLFEIQEYLKVGAITLFLTQK